MIADTQHQQAKPSPAIEFERALIGCLIAHGAAGLQAVQSRVHPDDFVEPVHRRTFEAITQCVVEGKPVTALMLRTALDGDQELAPQLSFGAYLIRLMNEATPLVNAAGYADAVADFARRRRLMDVQARYGAALADAHGGSASVLAREMQAEIDAITSGRRGDSALERVRIGRAAQEAVAAANAARAGETPAPGIPVGVKRLDDMLGGGLHRQKLYIVAGRPGMGKTTIGLSLALSAAKHRQGVYFVSLEMSGDELSRRALASMAYDVRRRPLTYNRITWARDLEDEEVWRLNDAATMLDDLPIQIEQEPGLGMAQIATRAHVAKQQLTRQGFPLGVIVIDHLGLIKAEDRYRGNRVHEIAEMTGALKNLSRTLDCAVVLLSQLNRAAETRDNKRPQLSDLRDSGSIEQDADVILGLFREAYYLKRDAEAGDADAALRLPEVERQIEIAILKQRNGETGRVLAFADIGCNVVTGFAE